MVVSKTGNILPKDCYYVKKNLRHLPLFNCLLQHNQIEDNLICYLYLGYTRYPSLIWGWIVMLNRICSMSYIHGGEKTKFCLKAIARHIHGGQVCCDFDLMFLLKRISNVCSSTSIWNNKNYKQQH